MSQTDVKLRLALEGAKQVESGLQGVQSSVKSLGSTIAASLGVHEFVRMADSVTALQNQLNLATGSANQSARAYAELFDIAQRSRVSFTDLGATFAAISRNGAELGISQARLLKVTESIGNAMTISGGSADSMKAALVQLGQGMASGTLRGEELNSVMEQTPRLAKALADGMGVSIGQLRQMGQEGKITAQALIEALEKSGPQLMREVSSASLTVGQAMTQLGNSATKMVGELDQASGAGQSLAQALQSISKGMDAFGETVSRNKPAVEAITYGLAGASVAAGIGAVAANLGKVRTAMVGIGAVMSANPAMLALLGIGAGIGVAVSAVNARAESLEGMQIKLKELERLNTLGNTGMYGTQVSSKVLQERNAEIARLRAAIAAQQPVGVDTTSEDARLSRQNQGLKDQAALQDRLNALLQAGSGVSAAYISRMQEIGALHAAGVLVGKQYNDAIDAAHGLLKKNTTATKELSAHQRLVNSGLELYADLMGKNSGVNVEFSDSVRKLAAAHQSGKIGLDDYSAAVRTLQSLQPGAIAAARENTEAVDALFESQERARLANEGQIKDARLMLDQIQFETSLIGLNTAEREQATLARDLERQGIVKGTQAYEAYISQLKDATLQRSVKQANADTAQQAAADWKKASEQIEQALTDALMNGGKSGADYIESLFRTMVLKPVVQAIVSPVASSITGALGLGNAASGASSLLNMGSFGGAAGAFSAGFGGGLETFSAGATMVSEATGFSSAFAGLSQMAGAAAPWLAGAGIAMSLGDSLFGGGGGPKTESTQTAWASSLESTIEGMVQQLGGAVDASISAFTSMDKAGDDLTDFSATLKVNGQTLRDRYTAMGGRDAAKAGRSDAELAAAMEQEAARMLLVALQASNLPAEIAQTFSSLNVASASAQQVDAAVAAAQRLSEARAQEAQAAQDAADQLAKVNQSWQDKLDLLTGKTTERELALRDAADDSTRALMQQVYAQEDLAAAADKASALVTEMSSALEQVASSARTVADAEAAIADIQLQAQIDAANATNAAADAMAGYAKTLRDYLAGETQTPSAQFASTLSAALAGDADAMQALPGVAKAAQDQALQQSATAAEYALRKAQVLAGVGSALSVADAAAANRAVVPVGVSDIDRATQTLKEAIDALRVDLSGAIKTDLINKIGQIDTNLSATVDITEFRAAFGYMASESTLVDIFKTLDADGDGQISILEAIKTNTGGMASSINEYLQQVKLPTGQTVADVIAVGTGGSSTAAAAASSSAAAATAAAAAAGASSAVSSAVGAAVTAVNLVDSLNTALGTSTYDPVTEAQKAVDYVTSVSSMTPAQQAERTLTFQDYTYGGLTDAQKDVFSAYTNLLYRQPTQAELNSWAATGMDYSQLASAFSGTDEYLAKHALGAVYLGGIQKYASGGVFTNSIVGSPTLFNPALMGEAGPEAIMPLTRGPGGSLGVTLHGGMDLAAVVQELVAVRAELAQLRSATVTGHSAIASNTGKTARILERVTPNGDALQTEVAA